MQVKTLILLPHSKHIELSMTVQSIWVSRLVSKVGGMLYYLKRNLLMYQSLSRKNQLTMGVFSG